MVPVPRTTGAAHAKLRQSPAVTTTDATVAPDRQYTVDGPALVLWEEEAQIMLWPHALLT